MWQEQIILNYTNYPVVIIISDPPIKEGHRNLCNLYLIRYLGIILVFYLEKCFILTLTPFFFEQQKSADKGFYGTVVNRTCHIIFGESLEISCTVSLTTILSNIVK